MYLYLYTWVKSRRLERGRATDHRTRSGQSSHDRAVVWRCRFCNRCYRLWYSWCTCSSPGNCAYRLGRRRYKPLLFFATPSTAPHTKRGLANPSCTRITVHHRQNRQRRTVRERGQEKDERARPRYVRSKYYVPVAATDTIMTRYDVAACKRSKRMDKKNISHEHMYTDIYSTQDVLTIFSSARNRICL